MVLQGASGRRGSTVDPRCKLVSVEERGIFSSRFGLCCIMSVTLILCAFHPSFGVNVNQSKGQKGMTYHRLVMRPTEQPIAPPGFRFSTFITYRLNPIMEITFSPPTPK